MQKVDDDAPHPIWDVRQGARKIGNEISLGSLAWQCKGVVLLGSFIAAVLTYIALVQFMPIYEGKTRVMLGNGVVAVVNIPNVVPEKIANVGLTASALIVMKSTDVLRSVVEKLDLDELKEFNPDLREPGFAERIRSALRSLPFLAPEETGSSLEASRYQPRFGDDPLSGTLRGLRSAISVRVLGESQVVEIVAQSRNPRLAALIGDTVAEKYIERQLSAKIQAGTQATEWLKKRATGLREVLSTSEQRVAKFRRDIVNSGKDLADELELRLTELNKLISAEAAERADFIGRRDEMEQLLSDSNYIALTKAINSPAVANLHERFADLNSKVTQFGEHPSVLDLKQKRELTEAQLRQQIEQAISGLSVKATITGKRLNSMKSQMQATRRELAERRQDELTLVELEREAKASRDIYNRFLLRLKEVREHSMFQTPEALIVSFSEVPIVPVWPQKSKMAVVAGLAGGGLTLAVILFAASRNRHRVREPEQVAALTGVPDVYQLPEVRGVRTPSELLRRIRQSFASPVAGSIQWLRLRVGPNNANRAIIIAVTSAGKGEGKSTLSLLLAESFAIDGYTTALVNADPNEGGLSDTREYEHSSFRLFDYSNEAKRMLAKQAGLEESLKQRLRALKRIDVIVIDGPAALISPEMIEISALADHVILTCTWSQTTVEQLKKCVDVLRAAQSNISAIAINRVSRKHIRG